jgi:hypothetical protein
MSGKSRFKGHNPFSDPPGSPSLIKAWPPPWPVPKDYRENPNPPADPQYRPAWEAAMADSAKNFPDDPVYAPYRFRVRGNNDDG